jgi:hypothetical protein
MAACRGSRQVQCIGVYWQAREKRKRWMRSRGGWRDFLVSLMVLKVGPELVNACSSP